MADVTYNEVSGAARLASDGFSFADVLGGAINNSEFGRSYLDSRSDEPGRDSYVWRVLSAVGQDIGRAVYSNVRNYVDAVSNVETCKVKALRSMVRMLGVDYSVFDSVDMFPLEVLELMDVLSIDRKHLAASGKVEPALAELLSAAGALYEADGYPLSDYVSVEGAAPVLSCMDDAAYERFVARAYAATLSSFLTLEYCVAGAEPGQRFYVYPEVVSRRGVPQEEDDEMAAYRLKTNIGPDFRERDVVDRIDQGLDSLDAYTEPYLTLLKMEQARRARRATSEELRTSAPGLGNLSALDDAATKYAYYRVQKVQEYVDFIDSKYYIDAVGLSGAQTYDMSPDYYCIQGGGARSVISAADLQHLRYEPSADLDAEMVSSVAESLAMTTMYMRRLREKIRLQTRKNYMKGTNNLILYIVNEYLCDYSLNHAAMRRDPALSAAASRLSAHSIEDAEVVEYYDGTEYQNIKTETSVSA